MNNTLIRLSAATALVVLVYGGTFVVQGALKPARVDVLDWDLNELPLQFGDWTGEDRELDPEIFQATGANAAVDRIYHDHGRRLISVHTAIFHDWEEGIYHNPNNCYRSKDWSVVENQPLDLKLDDGSKFTVRYMTWRRNAEKIRVLYWYQLGGHAVFTRWDMGWVRWKMGGREVWPPLVKVQMSTPATDQAAKDEQLMKGLARRIQNWIARADQSATGEKLAGRSE